MTKEKQTFEESLEELEIIVKNLESDDLLLDESLEMYEKGVILYKHCKKQLGKVEKKIAKLSEDLKEKIIED